MIYLTKGQRLFDNPSLVVYDPTGYYNDGDSVICAGVTSPNEPVCRYEAKFVAYGGIVYSVADPDALMKQILAIDPKTLFGKDSQRVAVDKMVEEIVPQESGVLTEDATTEVVDTTTDTATTTPQVNLPQTPQTSTTTPQINLPQTPQTSTTTPQVNFPQNNDTSTTTPQTNTSTTTPGFVVPDTSSSTTTPQTNTSTTTPVVIVPDTSATSTPPLNMSTSTPITDIPVTPPSTDTSSTTPSVAPTVVDPPVVIPPALETPIDTNATSSEVVAFAKNLIKKKITKKLGL